MSLLILASSAVTILYPVTYRKIRFSSSLDLAPIIFVGVVMLFTQTWTCLDYPDSSIVIPSLLHISVTCVTLFKIIFDNRSLLNI